jgi:hypothetical protein
MTDEPPEKMRERAERNGYKNGTQYGSLLSQVKYGEMLPTPTTGADQKTQYQQGGRSLMNYMDFRRMLPTPIKSDCTPARPTENWNGSDLGGFINRGNTGKIFQLNPPFVAEMMGFPTDWTASPFLSGEMNLSKPTGTQ